MIILDHLLDEPAGAIRLNSITNTEKGMTKIEKLIDGYENLIELKDIEIGQVTERIRKFRDIGNQERADEFRQEKTVLNAKRQLFVQFVEDLKEIQDLD